MNEPTQLRPYLESSWQRALQAEFDKPYFINLMAFLEHEQACGKHILPQKDLWFNALNSTPLQQVSVVVLGQDPYPTPGHAHGLCFSVEPDVTPLPKSLNNINKELLSDLGINNTHTGCLQSWANQGVLLLNAVLTVEAGNTHSHQKKGWETFTDAIIQQVAKQNPHCVFILWGAYAQKKGKFIDRSQHLVIESVHPSPLSAYRGFFSSCPFSKTNAYLIAHHKPPINWHLQQLS